MYSWALLSQKNIVNKIRQPLVYINKATRKTKQQMNRRQIMKKALAITAIVAFMGMVVAQPALAGTFAQRHFKQDQRIFQGIHSGELTRGETRHLFKQQRHLQQKTCRAWSDGTLTRKERAHLERKQDKFSANIYRLKHNNRDRN